MLVVYSLLAVLLLCLTHVFVHRLNFTGIPRSKWLSIAGGISVAYIFLEAFPELHRIQTFINEENYFTLETIASMEIYIVSLVGLTFFYGLENRTSKSDQSRREPKEGGKKNIDIFWVHIWSFAIYNFIIGYLLINREKVDLQSMVFYAIAMAFHFIVTDHSLEDHFSDSYRKLGRWILVAAIFLGWLISLFVRIPEIYIGVIFGFIAGGVIMNVLKEELPKERESNLFAFCTGIAVYGVILILMS